MSKRRSDEASKAMALPADPLDRLEAIRRMLEPDPDLVRAVAAAQTQLALAEERLKAHTADLLANVSRVTAAAG